MRKLKNLWEETGGFFFSHIFLNRRGLEVSILNIGMRSMQELLFFFGWVGWDGTLCLPDASMFVTEKEHNFQKNEKIALCHLKRRKKN